MSLTASPSEKNPEHGARSYQLQSELLKSTLPRNQKSPEIFMIWLNTLCAVYLGVGILGARNPDLFVFRPQPTDETPIVLESNPKAVEPEQPKTTVESVNETLPESFVDALPVVVPVPVIDIREATFARPVEGLVTLDTKKLGTFDRATPNLGVVGPVAKPGNPNAFAQPTTVPSGGGRRRLTADDVEYGPPVPQPQVNKHGRVHIDAQTRIWVSFGADGAVTDVRIEPSFSHAGYEREVRSHIRKHWKSKIGATSGWAPVI